MKKIELTRGKFTLVDDDDYDKFNPNFSWWLFPGRGTDYAITIKSGKSLFLHRAIMNAPKGLQVDHINGNGLDNRKENLRLCTATQNKRNVKNNKRNKSGYRGVSLDARSGKYKAQISTGEKILSLGSFDDPVDAAKAYDNAALKYHGEFASLNFPSR